MNNTDDNQLLFENNSENEYENSIQVNRFRNVTSINANSSDDFLQCSLTASYRKKIHNAMEPGSLNLLSAKYESLDYDVSENYLLLEEEKRKGYRFIIKKNLARWFIFIMIGIVTAMIGCTIDISVEELCFLKFNFLKKNIDKYVFQGKLYVPYLLWVAGNIFPVFIGSILVAYVEPVAGGSGIPAVKCYLNGINIPHIVRVKTLFVKVFGVITTIVGGLTAGKEGPMIHSGAIVAAGISQGKSTSFRTDFRMFRYFREDHEKRDFVSGGAAAGVSAAFGSPVGGVLFSLEEGTSFWNQSLTWKTFVASVVSAFTLNVILSAYNKHSGQLNYFGKFEELPYNIYELPIFVLMGIIGGLLGSLWNHINYKFAVFRSRFVRKNWLKVFEACIVAAITATTGFLMIFIMNECKPLRPGAMKFPVQLYCEDGEYNTLASIWFEAPGAVVKLLLHDPLESHSVKSLLAFAFVYFLLSCWTFGLSISSGLFIPTLITGAAWGRVVALIFRIANWETDPGKYALIGAAAQLGGTVRMTISLTVIIVEGIGNISFALPLIVTLIAAKWTGDFFNEGIYDICINLAGIPILPWEPPPLSHTVYASEVMSHPVVTFKTVENVGHIVEVLKLTSYNGFPVVDPPQSDKPIITTYGRLRGLILRLHLIVILERRLFNETPDHWAHNTDVNSDIFRDEYPRFPKIEDLRLTEVEKTYSVDLRPFMNRAPYTVLHSTSLPRMFRLFRGLGLRHLPIVNDENEVIGIVTRKDLARYRVSYHHGKIELNELIILKEL